MKFIDNEKGMALITVLLAVVIVTMLATMVMMTLVNELKGNTKIEELAKARYEVEGLIEAERANIYYELSDEATQNHNSYSREATISEKNSTQCQYNQHSLLLSYDDISSEEEAPYFVLEDIFFQEDPKKIVVTCANSQFSMKATFQIPQSIASSADVDVDYISIERSE